MPLKAPGGYEGESHRVQGLMTAGLFGISTLITGPGMIVKR